MSDHGSLEGDSDIIGVPVESPAKSGKNPDLGSGGSGAIVIGSFIKRLAQKLRRIILLHFGLVTFRTHLKRTRKTYIFMILGLSGRDHDVPNQLYSISGAPRQDT